MYTVFHYHLNGIRVMERTFLKGPEKQMDRHSNFRGYNIKPCHVFGGGA